MPVLQLIHNYVILHPVKLQAIQARDLQYKTPVKFTVKIRRIDCGIKQTAVSIILYTVGFPKFNNIHQNMGDTSRYLKIWLE